MRVLLSTTANSGHFGPMVPIARACVIAGHEVVVAAPTSFAGQIEAAGFEHRAFADVPPHLIGPVFARLPSLSSEEADRVVVADVFGRLDAQAAWPGIVDIISDWAPDIVVRDPMEFGSAVAAVSAGVPQATVAIGMSAMQDYVSSAVAVPLAELDQLAGLAPGSSAAAIHAATTFTCVPPVLDGREQAPIAGAGAVHRFRDESLVSEIAALPEEWGDPAQLLAYISFGSVAAALPTFRGVYADVLSAFADQPVRVLMTTGHAADAGAVGPVPGNVCVKPWWPQQDVLRSAAAVVCHGGFGTSMAALAAGVPLVVLPLFAVDQRINAEHVAAVGAGVHLAGGPAAVAQLPGAVQTLLDGDVHRRAAQAVADEMADLAPVSEVVHVLQSITGATLRRGDL